MSLASNLFSKFSRSVELSINRKGMSCSVKKSFSFKIILSCSVPCSCEGLEVIQLCAVIIGRLVSLLRLVREAGLV